MRVLFELFEEGDYKGCSFTGTGSGHCYNVAAEEGDGEGLTLGERVLGLKGVGYFIDRGLFLLAYLNWSRDLKAHPHNSFKNIIAQPQRLKSAAAGLLLAFGRHVE